MLTLQTKIGFYILSGKVDSSFLCKNDSESSKKSELVTKDLCKNITSRYEKFAQEKVEKPLYSVKRKPVVLKKDVDTMQMKKQQTEYQWKYKQKTISELHCLVNNNKQKVEAANLIPENKSYVSSLPTIDFASRLKDEEKKMEEFELFMTEIHNYLENETHDEEESEFKWSIQSYLDLIEDETPPSNVAGKPVAEIVPKVSTEQIKEKLLECSTQKDITKLEKVGKIDMSFLETHSDTSVKKLKPITEIKENLTLTMKNQLETAAKEDKLAEKVAVRRKLIPASSAEEMVPFKPRLNRHEWKYKQKTMSDLQQFIQKNHDIAPVFLNLEHNERIDGKTLIERSNKIISNLDNKEGEFQRFLNELEDFSKTPSNMHEEASFKVGIKQYLSLIEQPNSEISKNMPALDSALKVSDIKSKLHNNQKTTKHSKNRSPVGKISNLFLMPLGDQHSKIEKDKVMLPMKGNASLIKKTFESKPKLVRSASEICVSKDRLKKEKIALFDTKLPTTSKTEIKPSKYSLTSTGQKELSNIIKSSANIIHSHQTKKPIQSEWDHILDPEERKNAILAKYGFKPAKQITEDDNSDIDEYLNYEQQVEVGEYSEKLKELYQLDDSLSDSDRESSPVRNKSKKGSFSSLMNILQVMKKSKLSKTFSESLTKVNEFGKSNSMLRQSDVDLSLISGSCSNIKHLFESGKVYENEIKKQKNEEDLQNFQTKDKKMLLESMYNQSLANGICDKKQEFESDLRFSSLSSIKTKYESTEKRHYAEDFKKMPVKKIIKYHDQTIPVQFFAEENEENSILTELEALRQSQKEKQIFRIEKGVQLQNVSSARLKRSVSCIGISDEKVSNDLDLDEDTLKDVSQSNKAIKAMFESAAPKYKFGGSGSNLSIKGSKENIQTQSDKKQLVSPKDERKWVLDSINKYFDVIVEENEGSSEGCDSESTSSTSECSEEETSNDSDDEQEEEGVPQFQSTAKIRGMFSTVVSNLSKSVNNLAQTDLVSNLKRNLGSHVNLRGSTQELDHR